MIDADRQHDALEVLKSLNSAVTTTKLYPPSFPQVANAVENAYTCTTNFLEKYGSINFSIVDDQPNLCGAPVKEKTLGKMHGEAIYQQLKLLKLDHVVIEKELYESLFQQLLIFFTTSPQLVTKEGGGRSFVVNLGLNELFPTDYMIELPDEWEDQFATVLSTLIKENKVQIENIQELASDIDGETIGGQKQVSSLFALKEDPDKIIDLLVAAIANLLKGITRSSAIFFPPAFLKVFRNIDRVVEEKERGKYVDLAVKAFRDKFGDFGLHILILQNYPSGFGSEFFERLVIAHKNSFEDIVKLVRDGEAIAAKELGTSSDTFKYIVSGKERLFTTPIGKQFLVREKAKNLLEEGERERQAKRIQAGISAILQGDIKALRNREVIAQIPATVESLISKGKDGAAATIIENITTELLKGDQDFHDGLSESLSLIGESLINKEKWDWLEKLSIPLMAWVKKADVADEACENIIEILQKLQKYYWKNEKDEKADKILQLFFAIRTGKLEKSDDVVALVGRIQDLSIERAPLVRLLDQSVTEENELVDRRLIMQGPRVARFLLNILFDSTTTSERLKILELLKFMGPILPPILLEKLADPMPWHGKRNLIKLLAETGSKNEANQIFDYLNHEDIRVQQETFLCICKLSEEDLKSNLLEALSLATGPMKEQVVKALSPMADEEVVGTVSNLLADWKHFSDEVRNPLIVQIAELLGRSLSKTAELALADFLKNEGKTKEKIGTQVWQAAKQAHRKIRSIQRELSKKQIRESRELTQESEEKNKIESQVTATKPRTGYAEEAHIEKLLVEGDTERARKLLVDLIDKASSVKQFKEAEKLREWLIEIDPSALNDIIRTAEAIEEAKSEGISNDYLQIWSKLYDNLTTEEFNALYYSMEHQTHAEEEILVKQGDLQPALYFVNQGRVKIYFNDRNSEVLVKIVEQGEIFGSDTFFDASVWTINAAALAKAEISYLPLKNTHNWSNEFPSLDSKLQDFSRSYDDLGTYLKNLNKNRRKHDRHPTSGTVIANILEKDGKDSGVQMKGELSDISLGGISYIVRISQKKNARILLGRSIRIQLPCSTAKGKLLTLNGVLLTIRSLYSMNNEYSVHVSFARQLSQEEQRGVIEAGKTETA